MNTGWVAIILGFFLIVQSGYVGLFDIVSGAFCIWMTYGLLDD